MRLLKRLLTVALSLTMLLTPTCISAMASDSPSSWALSQVDAAIQMELVPSRLQSNYKQATTRAEFCSLAVALYEKAKGEIVGRTTFIDTADTNVEKAAAVGIVYGVGNGRFVPNDTLTREQAATMLSRLADAIGQPFPREAATFADIWSISTWAIESVGQVQAASVMNGVGNNTFDPRGKYTREQSIATIVRAYSAIMIDTYMGNDRDFDGLSNEDEVSKYGTNPDVADTDGDGANDGWEVTHGYNPLVYDKAFNLTISIGTPDENTPVTASVSVQLTGAQADSLEITPINVADSHFLSPVIPGYLGSAYDFSVSGSFDTASLSFDYDKSLGTESNTFKPRIYSYDEETYELKELPNQTVANGHINAQVSHFSKYILLNKVEFDLVWIADIRPPHINQNVLMLPIDLVFVIDESNSMENMSADKWSSRPDNDPDRIRVAAAKKFTEALGYNDRAAVIGFSDSARILRSLENDKDVVKTHIDLIRGDMGGTAIYTGLNLALNELDSNSSAERRKLIICLTDGTDDPAVSGSIYDNIIDRANATNVVIYTIGLGSSLDEILLRSLANRTGGKYFYAETAESVYQGFDFVKNDAIDYNLDSNGDGISDYYAKLIFEGKLRLPNGSAEFIGIDFDSNPDMDGDGLLNGAELLVVERDSKVFLYMKSNPLLKDSDFDGMRDIEDSEPMRPNYYNERDILSLTDVTAYRYTAEARRFSSDFGSVFWDSLVTALSFTDLQKEYTTQMTEFFKDTATIKSVEDFAMQNLKRNMIKDTWDCISGFIDIAEEAVRSTDTVVDITSVTVTLTETGSKIFDQMSRLEAAVEAGNKSGASIVAYSGWVTRRINDAASNNLPAFEMSIDSYSSTMQADGGVLTKVSDAFKVINFGINVYELVKNQAEMWEIVRGVATLNASNEVFQQNIDVIKTLCHSSRGFTRNAAQFIGGIMINSYDEAMRQVNLNLSLHGLKTIIDLLPLPPVIAIAKAVFDICNAIFGWSHNAEIRARIVCQSDIADAVIVMVRGYYSSDDQANLTRHLVNLLFSHISGESLYLSLHNNDPVAKTNLANIHTIADRMNLARS